MFEIKNLKFKDILDITYLRLDGAVTCISGISGSGKTTLLRHLNRLYEPDKGEIFYNDVSLKNIDPIELRRKVVMLGQTPVLYEGTIEDNLQAGLRFSGKRDASSEELHAVLADMRLSQSLDSYCDKLSGGEKQRLCLGRILLLNAETYLMDEPSSALDKETEAFIIKNLSEHVKKQGKQLILVTHSDQIEKLFLGSIVRLKNGKLESESYE